MNDIKPIVDIEILNAASKLDFSDTISQEYELVNPTEGALFVPKRITDSKKVVGVSYKRNSEHTYQDSLLVYDLEIKEYIEIEK
ncbi:hypothetical protein [Breznakia blatticola]|uniref:hypothetical protein n=1 Tax=Breznakia blatticola TaxID=1754012 RepID=UPI001064CE95|nr:hypothetical protein [Breznakia blatticola]